MVTKRRRTGRLTPMVALGIALCSVPAADAAVIIVPDNNPSLRDAVELAAPGDTIQIRPGTYTTRVRIDRGQTGLTLEGLGGRPVIEPAAADDGVRVRGVDGVTIRGLEVRGGQRAVRIEQASGVTVEDVIGAGNKEGIRAKQTVNLLVRNCELTGATRGRGVRVAVSTAPTIEGTLSSGNRQEGVLFVSVVGGVIRGNTTTLNRTGGIRLVRSASAVVELNSADDNGRSGIRVDASPALAIANNDADGNAQYGIRVKNSPPITTVGDLVGAGNTATGNGIADLRVD